MKHRISLLLALALLAHSASPGLLARERVDPAGIQGALILSAPGSPEAAIEQFFKLAHAAQQRVVVLRTDAGVGSKAATSRLLEYWESQAGASLEIVRLVNEGDRAIAGAALREAAGVWLIGDGIDQLGCDEVRAGLGAVLGRGGVVAGSGATADACGEAGLGLLPGALIDASSSAADAPSPVGLALAARPSLVGYEIGRGAALLVSGRQLRALGEGGGVKIHLAASAQREGKQIALGDGGAEADLTALRLAAIARQSEPFPAAEPPLPKVAKGTLIIIGGGGMPKGIIARFVELAGGDAASIVVLPTAMPDPIASRDGMAEAFRKAGAGKVTVLPGRTLGEVESDAYLEALRGATGIWFGGGRQWRFADAYLDTEALAAMHGVLHRGGVIMGSSAGASIQADYLARANPLGNLDIMAEGYERGLGFLQGVAIDQHFAQRKRFKDMASLVERYPQLLGIGIDESTALIVAGQVGAVDGSGQVHFFDRRKPPVEVKPDYESVGAGGRYDLVERHVLGPEE